MKFWKTKKKQTYNEPYKINLIDIIFGMDQPIRTDYDYKIKIFQIQTEQPCQ